MAGKRAENPARRCPRRFACLPGNCPGARRNLSKVPATVVAVSVVFTAKQKRLQRRRGDESAEQRVE